MRTHPASEQCVGHVDQLGGRVPVKDQDRANAIADPGVAHGPLVVGAEERSRQAAAAVRNESVELAGALRVGAEERRAVRDRRRKPCRRTPMASSTSGRRVGSMAPGAVGPFCVNTVAGSTGVSSPVHPGTLR